ncbi:MAG: radical SAM protein [Acidobacteriota bacterium]
MIALLTPPRPSRGHPGLFAARGSFPDPALAYLAGHLRARGHACGIVDAKFEGLAHDAVVARAIALVPRVVAISAYTAEIPSALRIADAIKRRAPWIYVVLGGPHASALPGETLTAGRGLDAVAAGEGEEILAALLEGGTAAVSIPGLWRHDGGPPPPAAPSVRPGITAAFDLWPRADIYYTLTYRGCPFPCSFCFRANGSGTRHRSVDEVIEELRAVARLDPRGGMAFLDATFAIDRNRTETLLDAMVRDGLASRLRWRCATRVDCVTAAMCRRMREAGCTGVGLGIEAGSDRVLARTGKRTRVEECRHAVERVKEAGLEVTTFFVLGHPGETREDVERTARLVVDLNPTRASISLMVPYPGTEVFELARRSSGGYRLATADYARFTEPLGGALCIDGLDVALLRRLRRRALLRLYLRNGRFAELACVLMARLIPRSHPSIARLRPRLRLARSAGSIPAGSIPRTGEGTT